CTRVVKRVAQPSFYSSILSSGRLQFASGMIAELTYGKGEGFWTARRDVEIQGSLGSLTFVRNEGLLTTVGGTQAIEVAPRKGLFVKDTKNVLAYLCEGSSLYVSSSESVYALKVSDALRRASESGQTVSLD
ncbi:MAG: Gfo/Idh/MocA family oxidoreductase, partial [Phormidesmis sp.]